MFSLHVDTSRAMRGGQNQVLLTVMGLRAAGVRAALVANPDGELLKRAAEGLELVPLAPRTEMDFSAAWRLTRVIKRLGPDVVHAHDPHAVAMAALALSFETKGPRPALVATRRVQTRMKQHAFSRWKYRQVDCFICASEAIMRAVIADGVEASRAVTVHEGIDLVRVDAVAEASAHAAFWLPHQAPLVGTVGALLPHKGQHDLIDAAALVVREVPDARFLVLGEGELRESLEHHIKHLHLERHVLLAGYRPDALGLVRSFDVFVMCSTSEGLGMPLLEAMACRRAVVASRVGGIPEVVVDGETGILVPARTPRALASAIATLLGDPRRRDQLGEAGRRRVEERFTIERAVGQTIAVYVALAGKPHAADNARPFEDD